MWVAKVKTKARKVRDDIRATGGGPAGAGLTDIEEKILEIVGSASINGFGDLEVGIPPSPGPQHAPPGEASLHTEVLPSVEPNQQITHTEAGAGMPPTDNNRRTNRRRGLRQRPRPPVNSNLVESLNENNRLLRQVIGTSSDNIAAAIVRAAEILASAIQSAGIPVFIQQDANNTT